MTTARNAVLLAAFLKRVAELGLVPGELERDDKRPVSDYPTMPPATCHLSSRYLAGVYPELDLVEGVITFRRSTRVAAIRHSWNTTPDGQIVDSTFRADVDDLTYWPLGRAPENPDPRGPLTHAASPIYP
ncbi:hypothetical protein [Jiangella rhizosphaerae]|uniref:Uncharacterized protein n=1 Tax=Jiangella rhizosphaerae TaxID=2293569 RepID=A0A418KPE7_9ACTN|nr:hypothetical protein [Jiangella rhizosphaerae]RIQ21262.1 hypothetical protein DY240_15685 [Jiangella rhizosphaerae]